MERILKMSDAEIQALIKKVELPTLLVALKEAGFDVGQAFRRNFSDSALAKIQAEYISSMVFTANQEDVEKARRGLLKTIGL